MQTLLRSSQRHHLRAGNQEVWRTAPAPGQQPCTGAGFRDLIALEEMRLPRGDCSEPHRDDEAEILTYVCRGALSQEDSTGASCVIHAGEFQAMSTGCRIRQLERSVSQSDWTHLFRIFLRPSEVGLDRAHEQRRFTAAERRNRLCVVASPDGRRGSLRLHQGALIYSSTLDPGHHIVHALEPGWSAWLHIVSGEASFQDIVLTPGDGVGVTGEPSVSFTARESSEVLLIDLGPADPDPGEPPTESAP